MYEYEYIENVEDYEGMVASADHVIVDFFATWCGPCKNLDKEIKKAKDKYPDLKIFKVDIDESDEISDYYEVENLPTIFYYKKGEKKTLFMGSKYELFHKKIDELMAS